MSNRHNPQHTKLLSASEITMETEITENDYEEYKVNNWKQSPYAVGCVHPTWQDELDQNPGCCCGPSPNSNNTSDYGALPCRLHLHFSALICSKLGAKRVGNMAVLYQSKKINEKTGVPDILLVVGPFWPMMLFITYPLIFGVSYFAWSKAVPSLPIFGQVLWYFMTYLVCYCLFQVSFRDPGIMIKKRAIPLEENPNESTESWRWNDQAQTFRPRGAFYDSECGCVIEDFDHTCPWTGTGIGKKNLTAFHSFVGLVIIGLVVDILLITSFIPSS